MIQLILIPFAFFSMEVVAWLSHKYIMHGLMWTFHRDHHQKNQKFFFERNDFFFLLFAIPGIILIFRGAYNVDTPYLWLGIGISLYGAAYFLVHDVFIHQRLKLFTKSNNFYLRAIRKAHKVHHRHLDRHNGECFGMLWVPLKYFREALKSK